MDTNVAGSSAVAEGVRTKIMVDIDLLATHVKFILYGLKSISVFGGLPQMVENSTVFNF